ncbi:hypothetical protein FHP25_23020 [Vineibacter terrae]|uniref:DUF4412 domain-containing protein n=1 Tax=Vineibacter terrae TaxID=2586908 RepID=A0A5C8PHC1_9HYPH|nr:hypothetical protein [Vineibacter terrae]TXL73070.1 hypothetical protein FHP25_23020 [Vineibacter terrae]
MRRLGPAPLALLALALPSAGLRAEPLPKPTTDYVAEGTITSGKKGSSPASVRHGAGKLRVDTEVDGKKAAIFIDLEARTATVVSQRLGQKIAMQIDPERAGEAVSMLDRDARRVGEAKIAGETCDEYEFETAKGHTVVTCVTRDGIALRTRDVSRNRVIWEASRVTRGPQDAAQLVVPSDALPLQIPKLR